MGLKPTYKVIANQRNITELIQQSLVSLRVTDEAGQQSDDVELFLADPEGKLVAPANGTRLEIYLGYDDQNIRMGSYFVDEVKVTGPPDQIQITAKAAPYATKEGAKLQTHKTRTWPAGTTLGAMVKKVAYDHKLAPVVDAKLASIALPQISQTDESDIHLLTRVARQYNATIKPADGRLVMVQSAAGLSATGKALPVAVIHKTDVTSWSLTIAKRNEAGCVVASYHDPHSAKTQTITVGSGEPRQKIRHKYPSASAAQAAAQARLHKKQRGGTTASITMPGNPRLQAEGRAQLVGFRAELNRIWNIKRVEHNVTSGGYTTTLELEA